MSQKSVVNASIMLMVMTVVSKLFGITREMLLAYYFGASNVTDAYVVAQSCSNFLIAGITGCVVTALIKNLVIHEKDIETSMSIMKTVAFVLLLCGALFAAFVIGCPKAIVKIFAAGFSGDALGTTATILRFMAPMVLFQVLTSVLNAFLQSKSDFFVSGIGNIVQNVFIILGVFLGHYHILFLGLGWTAGQFALCTCTLFRGYKPHFIFFTNRLTNPHFLHIMQVRKLCFRLRRLSESPG